MISLIASASLNTGSGHSVAGALSVVYSESTTKINLKDSAKLVSHSGDVNLKSSSDSVMVNLMAEFDGLINNFTTTVNDVLKNVTMTPEERIGGILLDFQDYYAYNPTDQDYTKLRLYDDAFISQIEGMLDGKVVDETLKKQVLDALDNKFFNIDKNFRSDTEAYTQTARCTKR